MKKNDKTAFFLLFSLLASLVFSLPASALTAQEQAMLSQLSPSQRALADQYLQNQGGSVTQQGPLAQPTLVVPATGNVSGSAANVKQYDEALDTSSLTQKQQQQAVERRLKPFGYDLFAGAPTTFAPATDIPIPSEYIIGPGDILNIQLFGKKNAEYKLVVSREGVVNIPELGPFSVVGQRFDEMKSSVDRMIQEKMIGVNVNINMGELRSIRVFVLGDANRPGSYTVSSLSTMTNALFVSGGIKEIGSLRNIQLKRNGKLITTLDLYDLLLRGDTSGDSRLQPGDVIFIPPVGKTVGVAGEIRRPGIYELKNEQHINEIIEMAGKLLATGYFKASQIERITQNGEREIIDLATAQNRKTALGLKNGDVLRVYSVSDELDNVVRLEGHVGRPGVYQWFEGMHISDLINSLDRLQANAATNYVVIRRQDETGKNISVLSVDIEQALANKKSAENIILHARDKVFVFSQTENPSETLKEVTDELRQNARKDKPEPLIRVSGLVNHPGLYPLETEMRVADIIRAAGSFRQDAYTLAAELTRFEVVYGIRREQHRINIDLVKALSGDDSANIELKPFDILLIRKLPAWEQDFSIEIGGEVRFPGSYTVKEGDSLLDVINRAGGLTEEAYPHASVFMRKDLRVREQEQITRLKEQLKSELATKSLEQDKGKIDTAAMTGLLQQLDTAEAAGRLVINLPSVLNGDEIITVKDGDRLLIPKKPQEVVVIGEINYPTSHIYSERLTRDDYISRSGGLNYRADDKRIYVVRANGEVLADSGNRWFAGDTQSMKPGDTIVVPLDVDRMAPLTLWTNVSQIFYQIGVAAAAWKTVGVF